MQQSLSDGNKYTGFVCINGAKLDYIKDQTEAKPPN